MLSRATVSFLMIVSMLLSVPTAGLPQSLNDPTLRWSEVVAGLSQPTAMVFIGPGRHPRAAKKMTDASGG